MEIVPTGLCSGCVHSRKSESARGSVFHRCLLHDVDPRYVKYPRLPVVRCNGHEIRAEV